MKIQLKIKGVIISLEATTKIKKKRNYGKKKTDGTNIKMTDLNLTISGGSVG